MLIVKVVCSDSFIPEIWFEEPNRVGVLTPQSKPPPKVSGQQHAVSGSTTITVITTTTTINPSGEVKVYNKIGFYVFKYILRRIRL